MKKWLHRKAGVLLSLTLLCGSIFPHLPPGKVLADSGVVEAWGEGWHYYCIDGFGYASNGVCSNGDKYTRVNTEAELNSKERSILFWALLSFMSAYGGNQQAAGAVAAINQKAEGAGLKKIGKAVTEEDLKGVIHSSAVRTKYDWLDFAVDHEREYLKLAGLLEGSGGTYGGAQIPTLLENATSLQTAARAAAGDNGFVLLFDPSGRDGDFLEKVPLKLSVDGSTWQEGTVNGWNVEKSRTEIRLTNPNPEAGAVYLKFDPSGTEYASSSGGYSTPDECYISSIEVWKCIECCNTHFAGGKTHPLKEHQRNVWLELKQVPAAYYASTAGGNVIGSNVEGELRFQIYRHEEDMRADYLVQLYKYDYETGNPLEGVSFDLYERFDDRGSVNRNRDGAGQIYEGGEPYEGGITHTPVIWDGFRRITSVCTDENGHVSYGSEKAYHYDKTFCDGHPAPVFVNVPEEETDGDTGEVVNQPEIDEARAVNGELAEKWLGCVSDCQEKAVGDWEGVHFHWIMEEVDCGRIEEAALSGDYVEAGATESAQPEDAYERSGCRQDCRDTYDTFISMKYSYTFIETAAREGYILHGIHSDDIPIEIITTDSSQNGANARFGNGYSQSITEQFLVTAVNREENSRGNEEIDGAPVNYYTDQVRSQTIMPVLQNLPSEFTADFSDHARRKWQAASASNGMRNRRDLASPSDSQKEATPSEAVRRPSFLFSFGRNHMETTVLEGIPGEDGRSWELFDNAYEEALCSLSQGEETEKGPDNLYSHSSGRNGAEEAFRVYDHRTEGEIHINKRDMELDEGETQGDAVLEGAVYGLFASQDLVHPDGTTGIVFRQNDLVAIAATDKEGDASFLAITEAPGHTYDYDMGMVVETGDGWAPQVPGNLYVKEEEIDDYQEDRAYTRRYLDFQRENGSCWIGRPLLLGNYYVKELSRSEGYELSVNGRRDAVSNYGYSLNVTIPKGQGSVAVTKVPYVEPQSSGREEDTMPDVVNFSVSSQGTGEKGYDIALYAFPKGTRLYRKDFSITETQIAAGTGQMKKQYLFDETGQPIYQRADADYTYPKQNPDGSFVTKEVAVSKAVPSMGRASIQSLDEVVVWEAFEESEEDQRQNRKNLALEGMETGQFLYIKMKTEQALRANGYQTPMQPADGEKRYSDRTKGIYSRGVRRGQTDETGVSGVKPGDPAGETVYGYPVVKTILPKIKEDGTPLTVAEAMVSLLNFYEEHPWYSYGGIDGYEETEHGWQFDLYAGIPGNPESYIVLKEKEEESTIYCRIPWIPRELSKSPRWVYVSYSNVPGEDAFGTYEDFRSWQILGMYRCGAVLVTDAMTDSDGTIRSKTIGQNVYYEKGEILRDQQGNPLQAYEWVELTENVTREQEVYTWKEIPLVIQGDVLTAHMPGIYTDAYGAVKSDENGAMDTIYKLVLPGTTITLTEKELGLLSPDLGYEPGDTMGTGDYALRALGAQVQVYLDYNIQSLTGDGLYVKPVTLTYPGQEFYFQDGEKKPGEGTRKNPVKVEERIIRQSVKITKSVRQEDGSEVPMNQFRFKIYLKSNLERLYRDEDGNVVWLDRKGKETDPMTVKQSFPVLVPKLYTKVPHKADPLYKDHRDSAIANERLYPIENDRISWAPASGYTKILETTDQGYNYEKFFDAVSTANQDKWKDQSPSYTSHRPLGNRVNRSEEAEKNTAVSDNVRQFAITWYLDWEVAKLTEEDKDTGSPVIYGDELYDQALREAIKKSENYLKPFFTYDLDRIYSVEWDSEADGGNDKDLATLSADTEEEGWCFSISEYLPYGIYVIVEQQPMYAQLGDLKNRYYEKDKPREIQVPSVYESYEQALLTPEGMSSYYVFHKEESPETQAGKYQIRFGPENHIIKAHNYHGDFQVYKYGMDLGKVTNGADQAGKGNYFALTQSLYRPYQNNYNLEDDRTTGNVPYYLTEGMDGRQGISGVYRYSSVSEYEKDDTMTGAQKAYDGIYASMLVPWTMAAPENEKTDMEPGAKGESRYRGLAYKHFVNIPYKARLRIEKLDSETHENLLHDGAVFRIYKALSDDSRYGTGQVKVYEEETLIAGSREFLMAMCASNITKAARSGLPAGQIYTGFVPAGTPVCREEDQVIMTDAFGKRTGNFKAYITEWDGWMENPEWDGLDYGEQNTGYLETPQELEAGVYVLAEARPPAGYTRTKPVAVEIYSDHTAYYKEGDSKQRILAAMFEKFREGIYDTARIYIENHPVKVKIQKKRKDRDTITFKIDGRTDGSLSQIGGNPAYEYAYNNGTYLGYGWKKGTLEYLQERKDAGEQVDIVFRDGIFAGYGYITRPAEKQGGDNPYVAGALMTLYEGMELKASGDREDYRYEGLVIERSLTGNVTRMYVKEGYGGTATEYRQETGEDGTYYWNAVTIERPDTDILFYDLGDLDVFTRLKTDGKTETYGYDRDHRLVNLEQLEEDRRTITRTDREHSIFLFKGGTAYLELAGGDFTKISYNEKDKVLVIPEGAVVYHLDRDGNRDALTDPHTGMAYVTDEEGKIYVWPVRVTKDSQGRTVAADKIATSRVGTIGENQENGGKSEEGFVTGSWRSGNGEGSHNMSSLVKNSKGTDQDKEGIIHENPGLFEKFLRPVLDEHGLPIYFKNSGEIYKKDLWLYDRDGDPVRQKMSDLLSNFIGASYIMDSSVIYHRLGESYLLENTWITGERSPNDPFDTGMTTGQADLLKRVPSGIYIMEELKAPKGWLKGFPTAINVKETAKIQTGEMEDDQTKMLVRKIDGTGNYEYQILDMGLKDDSGKHVVTGTVTEKKGSFGHGQVEGVQMVLYDKDGRPAAAWETNKEPLYLEGIPQGSYVLKEEKTPEGFVACQDMKIQVENTDQVQLLDVYNDHTKVEFEKYTIDGNERIPVKGAEFTLYDGTEPVDAWMSGDGVSYREFARVFEEMYREYGTGGKSLLWSRDGQEEKVEYVSHRQINGENGDLRFPANAELLFSTEKGQLIRIIVYEQHDNRQGRDFTFEYQFDYKKLSEINDYAAAYDTIEGIHRLDYLPAGKTLTLVETRPPEGFGKATDRIITVEDTVQIQRHRILNEESRIVISKCVRTKRNNEEEEMIKEVEGARLALYRAGEEGELIKDQDHLAAWWISGQDGVYTETDWINGRIPEGYEKGDLKPHELIRLPDGVYYLVELESPDYYTTMEPVKITHSQEQQIEIIRVWNQPAEGELEILKKDEEGNLLQGALFVLEAHEKSGIREPVFTKNLSSHNGRILVRELPVGEIKEDGTIIPYEYRLKEVTPPEGYALDMEIYTFRFQPNRNGVSYENGQKAKVTLEITNEKTKVTIGKRDFEQPDQWVAGAEFAVYQVTGRDERGQYLCKEEPVSVWVAGEEEDHVLEGLTAGHTFLLKEIKVPEGYEEMKPVAFTLSADGRKICAITSEMGTITVHSYEDSDTIRSVEVKGRYAVKTEMRLEDEKGQVIAVWTAGGDGHVLKESDGIREGQVYTLTEATIYSDGSREISGRTTRRAHLSKEGLWEIPDREAKKVCMELTYEDGTVIKAWNPSEAIPVTEVENPAKPESPRIMISHQPEETEGRSLGALHSADPVWVTITCTNTTHSLADMILTAEPGEESVIIDPGQGVMENGKIRYMLDQMKPGECRKVRYACGLESGAKEASVTAVLQCMGTEVTEKKVVPVLCPNRLTVSYEVTGTGKYQENLDARFRIFLYTSEGEELKGRYEYEGSRRGNLKSGDEISLEANEYIVINPGTLYRNIRYQVICVSSDDVVSVGSSGQAGFTTGSCASFSREVEDPSQRTVFQKGWRYHLRETTFYSDQSERDSAKISFLLDDNVSIEGIWVMDRKQKAAISKLEITGHKELEGALMQILTEDRNVVEQWISGSQPHILEAVLIPGETYILHEEAAPMGYGYGEEIWFQVSEGEYVNLVVMEDKETEAVLSKKELTGDEELPGALMQIIDQEGMVVEQWISGTEPYKIQGKLQAGETYILHEEAAPDGYAYAKDVPFQISRDGRVDRIQMRDAPTYVEITKTDITGSRELPGAVLQILDKEGNLIESWVSKEEPYVLSGKLKAGETYILREEAAPDGYAYTEDIEFTVSSDGRADKVIMKDKATRIEIQKVDKKTGLGLKGAELELLTPDSQLVETWISTEEPYVLEGRLQAGETYVLKEKQPPSGYERLRQEIRIVVPREGETVTVLVENKPKSPVSKTPSETKEKEKKIGKVYGDYLSSMSAHGTASYQSFTNLGLPKTGDRQGGWNWLLVVIGGILSMTFMFAAVIKRKKRRKSGTILGLCLVISTFMTISAYGETVEVKPEGQIVVTGEVYEKEKGTPPGLPRIYQYKDGRYEQKSCQIVSVMTEGGTKEVEETIVYEQVEQTDVLPETVEITVTDERYRKEYVQEFPVIDVQFYNWRWTDGFEFYVTVEEADAEMYDLRGSLIPAAEEQPFAGYEQQLLELIGANPQYYRVTEAVWDGEAWMGENQKIYRQALATGQKYVADCRAVYGGTAVLEPMEGTAWQAVYEKIPEETEKEVMEETKEQPETLEPLTHKTDIKKEITEKDETKKEHWYETKIGQIVVSIGILFLLLPVIILLIRRREKRHNSSTK